MPTVKTIVRTDDPTRANWEPLLTARGFQLVNRRIPYPGRNRTSNATFVSSLDEAWELITAHDYGIRMCRPGAKRGNYIYKDALDAVWLS